jgi:hypothetical protein
VAVRYYGRRTICRDTRASKEIIGFLIYYLIYEKYINSNSTVYKLVGNFLKVRGTCTTGHVPFTNQSLENILWKTALALLTSAMLLIDPYGSKPQHGSGRALCSEGLPH